MINLSNKFNEAGQRSIFKPTGLFIGVIGIITSGCNRCTNTDYFLAQRPNFVFIIADDMGWNDCGPYGNKNVRTPNIDKLARRGMKFNQAFITISSSSPSRSSIITGMYPHNTDAEQLHWPLPPNKKTFVEQLKSSGYWTAQAGKWHMGDSIKNRFDIVHDTGSEGFQLSPTGGQTIQKGDGSGCEYWIQTIKERPKEKPFFIWLASVDPHRPYQDSIIPRPHSPQNVSVPPYLPDIQDVRKDIAQYYDEISRLDFYIGKVMEELDNQGISNNTLILFISDNGRPFPRDKTTLYDGGIKTPWIVRWPNIVKPGSECNSLVSTVDIAPTFIHLAGLEPHSSYEGKDFSKMFLNPDLQIHEYIYSEDNWHDFEDYTRAVRTKEYKYICNFYPDLPNTPPADVVRSLSFQIMRHLRDSGKLTSEQMTCFKKPRPVEELFDLINDPFELNNLVANPKFAGTLEIMRNHMKKIRLQSKDMLPAFRTMDEFDRDTGEPNEFRVRPRPSKEQMHLIIRTDQ